VFLSRRPGRGRKALLKRLRRFFEELTSCRSEEMKAEPANSGEILGSSMEMFRFEVLLPWSWVMFLVITWILWPKSAG